MVNYMSEMKENSLIKAGIAVSSPFDFLSSKNYIKSQHFGFYE